LRNADIRTVGTKEIGSASVWNRSIYAAPVEIQGHGRLSLGWPNPSRNIARMFQRPKDVLQWRGPVIMLGRSSVAYIISYFRKKSRRKRTRTHRGFDVSKSTATLYGSAKRIQQERSLIRLRALGTVGAEEIAEL
jgi:hypothetical protein